MENMSARPVQDNVCETIDDLRLHLRSRISEWKKEASKLTKKGCMLAYPHFATANGKKTNKMYYLGPQDTVTKKRPYTYVGVDKIKQQNVLMQIARYKRRESLLSLIENTEIVCDRIDRELHTLEKQLVDLDRKTEKNYGNLESDIISLKSVYI